MKLILFKRPLFSVERILSVISFIIIFICSSYCTPKKTAEVSDSISDIRIVPAPVKVLYKRGLFNLDKNTRVLLNLSDDDSKTMGKYVIDQIFEKTNLKLKIADRFTTNKISSGIEIIIGNHKEIKPEGFKVVISGNRIKILANDQNGIHYASNLIIDLFNEDKDGWNAAQVSIEDYPKASIRVVYLNTKDSIPNKSELIQSLKKNRINYLITQKKWDEQSSNLLQISDAASMLEHTTDFIEINSTVRAIYENPSTSDSMIFNITDISSLHKDSIAVLGEAMWSKPSKRNYKELINHLDAKQNK